mgnify:CR=1 FL=1
MKEDAQESAIQPVRVQAVTLRVQQIVIQPAQDIVLVLVQLPALIAVTTHA